MRFGLISDIHGNLTALDTVIADMGPVDQYWCLGDIVGYGPEPEACVQRLLELDHVAVMGNHDAAAVGLISARDFNGEARRAVQWTARQLSGESVRYLKSLPDRLEHDELMLVHGSPREPIWEYITDRHQAAETFITTSLPYIFVGHTHVAAVFVQDNQNNILAGAPEDGLGVRLGAERMIINPGSVGQPRDGDPRAAYAVIDTDMMVVEFHRVKYDIAAVQDRMRAVGASEWLIERLAHGR